MNIVSIAAIGCGLVLLPFLTAPTAKAPTDPPPGGRYVGSTMCKNCHSGAEKGGAFEHWQGSPHAKAYETLATAKAKEVGKAVGVDDPQQSEKCLKCHVTAYGVDKKELRPTFKMEMGVQCEACHGPGEDHQKKRMAEAMKAGATPSPVAADEIRSGATLETCTQCHNPESPTYQPFCFDERMKLIEHLDPRKKRTEEELKKLHEARQAVCPLCKEKKQKDGKGEDGDK